MSYLYKTETSFSLSLSLLLCPSLAQVDVAPAPAVEGCVVLTETHTAEELGSDMTLGSVFAATEVKAVKN
jgi:hypothetical protein